LNGWKFVALKSPAQRRCWKSFGRSFAAVRKRHHPTNHRVANPSRHFFNPVGPLLVDGATEHENSGRIHRGFLAPIWEWISHDLLPSMAAEYLARMRPLIADEKQTEIRSIRSDLVRGRRRSRLASLDQEIDDVLVGHDESQKSSYR
jgi:hypothetical protein